MPEPSGTEVEHARRLGIVADLRITQRDPDSALDEIAAAAARLFSVPGALVTIGLNDSHWRQGKYGLPEGFALSEDSPEEFVAGPDHSSPPPMPGAMSRQSPGTAPLSGASGARFFAGVPVVAADGRAVGTFCILDAIPRTFTQRDIELLRSLAGRAVKEMEMRAEREQAAQEIRRAQEQGRQSAEAAARTAHELKNPLTVIKGISSMLAADPKFPIEMRVEFLNTIGRQVDRLLRVIDETLDQAMLDAGIPLQVSWQTTDLADRIAHVAQFYDSGNPQHRIVTSISSGSHVIVSDPDKVDQILYNLIGNAIKYSPGGGSITISTKTPTDGIDEDSIEISIKDQGLGMTPEQLSRLFGRFARVHADSDPEIRGSGLGLYLSRRIIEALGGTIWAESEPGVGSHFHIRLPLRQAEDVSPSPV